MFSNPSSPPRLLGRLAVVGMSLAVVALGALAVWAAIVTQNGAHGLSQAGVQTSGHLRAVQSLSMVDTQTDALEGPVSSAELRELRNAQHVLRDALARMRNGGVPEASRIARDAAPIMRELTPAIERFLAVPRSNEARLVAAEEEMEEIMEDLQLLLNDLEPDPSTLLTTKLGDVTDSERTVRGAAYVLVPLGLVCVAACGWLLSLYRRRSQATMRSALETTTREARTDQLTGLANRRALLEELEQYAERRESGVLVLADLNGFKRYNDAFGHPAGDALLRRLGGKLERACDAQGLVARLGGDEFCVLFFGQRSVDELEAVVLGALREEGEGFRITASCGSATLPEEASDASGALRMADTRMYAAKVSAHPSAEHIVGRALLRMLDERHPGLGRHGEGVVDVAVACAHELGLPEAEIGIVERAAQLHDIGKVGIPTELLTKPGSLSEEEWDFIRRHPLIGERIIGCVPSMGEVGSIVRSSHERWDGGGYPDQLAGEAIPVGARVVAIADAFCAMTEGRPYAQARSVEQALDELRACAGSQFDPGAVEAFMRAHRSRGAPAKPLSA